MLKLLNITKNYLMKDQDPVRALRGITLNFRRNEFVAVLGPSGCGKTTLLNIIGGLDRYTDGDLVIKGKSTKHYSDRDWDTYRNHSIGFVFQAYNLIGHQSVLKNVELALTIGGIVDKKERKDRAIKALERVGLKGMEKKRPNQLSGGQMQRVAIARALVNNPEILLADEPTGALDSETSIQIMDLLKEVAKDRLVIMVTHNPDLAEKYATRIVNIFDGVITGDTNPFDGIEKPNQLYRCPKCGGIYKGQVEKCPKCGASMKYAGNKKDEEITRKNKKSSMSFLTAASLSIANLFSKSKRTILVAIAGSIGIFGVSTVLAASTGVRHYIDSMQDDMLSSYPLTIAEEAVDMTSLMTGLYQDPDSKIADFNVSTEIGLNSMIDYLMDRYSDFTKVKTNTINEDLVKFVQDIPSEHISSISYSYGIDPTNNIFTEWKPREDEEPIHISLNGLTQRYIAELKTVEGFSQYASYVDLFTDFMKLIPGEKDYILSQYDLLGDSHFPENENEIMLVVESDSTLTDLVFAQLGYYQEEEVMNIAKKAIRKTSEDRTETDEELDELYHYATSFDYKTLLGKDLTYYPHGTIYHYDDIQVRPYKTYNTVLKNAANDEFYSLQYSSNSSVSFSKGSIVYSGTHIELDPFSHDTIYAIKMKPSFDPTSLLSGEGPAFEELIANSESEDPSEADPSYGKFLSFDLESARALITGTGTPDYSNIGYIQIENEGDGASVCSLFDALFGIPGSPFTTSKNVKDEMETVTGYQYNAIKENAEEDWGEGTPLTIAGILRPKKGVSFGCLSRGVYYTKEFQDKYIKDAIESDIILDPSRGFQNFINLGRHNTELYNAYVTFKYTDWTDPDNPNYDKFGYASCLNGDLGSSFGSLFSGLTGGTNYANENATHFRSLCGLKIVETTNENNEIIARDFKKLPEKISIYPINFETKAQVNKYLDRWNSEETITLSNNNTLTPKDRDELTYTDTISLIISVINTMIDIITTALIIFTSLSLIVSSFMIAVITYISVMERVKEIGVIRSLGGRKRDVSRLFIAENLVTGVLSGVIGLGITAVVCVIINLIVSPFGIPSIALLTLPIMGIMLLLSVFLSVMAGLIPSMHASRQDPVIALRSE